MKDPKEMSDSELAEALIGFLDHRGSWLEGDAAVVVESARRLEGKSDPTMAFTAEQKRLRDQLSDMNTS